MQQICSVCGVAKSLNDFHRNKNKPLGVSPTCKDCAKERARRWFKENSERGKQTRAAWHVANREAMLVRMKQNRLDKIDAYRAANRKWATENKERKREMDRRWHAANPDKSRLYHRVNQTRRRLAEGTHTANDILRIMKMQRNRCAICKVKLRGKYHVDHIVPIARGGTHWPSNLQILCAPCNTTKHARDPIDHMQSLGRLL
jgi:5-methylcytosine-specific restriction endonuclease McrA